MSEQIPTFSPERIPPQRVHLVLDQIRNMLAEQGASPSLEDMVKEVSVASGTFNDTAVMEMEEPELAQALQAQSEHLTEYLRKGGTCSEFVQEHEWFARCLKRALELAE